MTMVRDDDDDDDQRREGWLGEKRSFDLVARLLVDFVDEETRARRGKEKEKKRNSVGTKSFLGKRKMDELDSQQNPNHHHDASSSSKSSLESKRRLVVPDDEPIRAEPIREIKPPVRGKSVNGLTKQRKVLRGASSSHGHANENMDVDPNAYTVLGECQSQQNPNRHDASSSSMSSVESTRSLLVPEHEPIRAQPIREIKPLVRRSERRVMPEWLVNRMRVENGADAKLITEKTLQRSDVNTQQSRLLIPFNQIEEMDFLNEEELNTIEKDRRKIRKEGVPVTLVDSSGRKQWNVSLKRWDMKTSSNYLLNSGWNGVVRHHSLEEGQTIRLWTFHSQKEKLFFALELVPPPPPAPAMASGPDMALAPVLTQAPAPAPVAAAASSSTPAPVVTRDSDELYIGEASRLEAEEETNRRTSPLSPRGMRAAEILLQLASRHSDQNS